MIHKTTKTILRTFAFALALCATTSAWAAAPTPVAEWDGDLANNSTKGKYTMSVDSGDSSVVSFADNKATLTSSTSVASKGVQISWPDPTTDAESFTSKKMSVVIQYSGLSIPSGNTCLLGLPWNSTTSEYLVYSNSGNGKTCLATGVASANAGSQWGPSVEKAAPLKGKMLVTFSGDASYRPGVDLYLSAYNDATSEYGAYERIGYWSDKKIDNGTFYGLKIGGTIANTGKYYRPGMTVEAVQIYDDVVVESKASLSADATWAQLNWDKDKPDFFPASLYTYTVNVTDDATLDLNGATITAQSVIVNVTDDATLDLNGATIAAQNVVLNIPSGKKLTLTGTVASSTAPISLQGGGELNLTSDPGCTISVSSGAEATISGGETEGAEVTISSPLKIYGTLKIKGYFNLTSTSNDFYAGSLVEIVSGQTKADTYCSSYSGGFAGTLTIDPDATFVVVRTDTLNRSSTSVVINVYGKLKFDSKRWTVMSVDYHTINLYPGSQVIGSGDGNGVLDFEQNNSKLNVYNVNKAGEVVENGVATIVPAIRLRNSGYTTYFNIASGTTLELQTQLKGSGTIGKQGEGTLKIKNFVLALPISGSEGTIEIEASSGNLGHTFTSSTFSGVLKLTGTSKQNNLIGSGSTKCFSDSVRPELIADAMETYLSKDAYNGQTLYVRNLSGRTGAKLDARYTTGPISYTIDTLQERNTEYLGYFNNNAGDNRTFALNVTGNNVGGVHTLTLGGDNQSTNTLTVSNYAKVKFNSNGKWAKGPVVVGNNGFIEAQHTAALGAVTLQEGSTVVLVSGVPFTATGITLPASGTVYVDMSAFGLAEGSSATIMSATTLTGGANVGNLQATSGNYTFAVDPENANAIKATNMGTCVWDGDSWSKADPSLYSDVTVNVAAGGTTLTLDADYSFDSITLSGSSGSLTIVANNNTLTVGDVIIPNGVTLVASSALTVTGSISGGGNLTVPNGVTFTCAEGTIWTIGNSANASTINTGVLTVQSGGRLTVNGRINIENMYDPTASVDTVIVEDGGALEVTSTGTLYQYSNYWSMFRIWGECVVAGSLSNYGDLSVESTGALSVSGAQAFSNVYDVINKGTITFDGRIKYLTTTGYKIRVKDNGKIVFVPTDSYIGISISDWMTNGVDFGTTTPTMYFDVTNLSIKPTGTSATTLVTTSTSLTLTVDSLTGCSADYYVKQNVITGAVTLQLYAVKDDAGGYYRDATGALLAIDANHALTLTILDGTEEEWTVDALSIRGLERSGTSVYYVAARIGSTPYNSVQGAVDAAEDGETITLAVNSADSITLNGKSIVFSEGSYTFSGSFTGNGTIVLGAALKAPSADRWAAGWTGIVELKDITTVITDFDFAHYGNANSTVRANNVLVRMPVASGEYGNVGTIEVATGGLKFGGDPIENANFTFAAAITGTGTIGVGTRCETGSKRMSQYIFTGSMSGFAGGVDYNNTGYYKATIVFKAGNDEIPQRDTDEWGQILVSENTTLKLSKEMYGPAGIVLAGTINVLEGGSIRVDSPSGKQIKGSGTINYTTFPSSAPTFNNAWAGTVHLPGKNNLAGENFGNFGKSGSKIVIDGDMTGWIAQNTSVTAEFVLDGHCLTVNDFSPSSYSFSKISGSGALSFNHKAGGYQPSTLSIGEVMATYSGTINNNTTTTLTINKLVLPALPACDAKVLAVGGTGEISLDVGNVKVGEASLPAKYKLERRHVGEEDDGFYVYYYGTLFSVY